MVVPLNRAYAQMIKSFKEDCETLMKEFKETGSEDFKDFVPIWKALRFNLIYEKFLKDGMHIDLKEDTLQIAKNLMLTENFLGGMFLLYGLYFIQDDPKGTIKLELHEFQKITDLLRVERSTLLQTCQPGFMFTRLFKNDAFVFVKYSRDYSMEGLNRARLVHNTEITLPADDRIIHPKMWLHACLSKHELTEKIEHVENKFLEKKKKIKEQFPELNLSLDMVPEDFISGLQKYLLEDEAPSTASAPDIGTKRRKLKHRRMKIKRRYRKPDSEDEDELMAKKPVAKKRGCPKGLRKLYFKSLVNDPNSMDEDSPISDPDDPHLSLTEIE